MRYLRFGGRKAAYRHIHPAAHATRFRHGDGLFYFRPLEPIVRRIWPDAEYQIPYLLELVTRLGRDLQHVPPMQDQLVASGLGAARRHYVDVYPH